MMAWPSTTMTAGELVQGDGCNDGRWTEERDGPLSFRLSLPKQ